MTQRFQSCLLLWALIWGSLILSVHAATPNFIFFLTDDISLSDLGTYGGPVPTPNLDRMAAQGVLFENAYVTASSCSPSRASIITSRYPHNTGAPELHTPLPHAQWKFPGRLKRAGYYTVLSGKNHMTWNGVVDDNSRLADAFDRILKGGGVSGSERWVEQLKNRPRGQPFFYWFASHDAHRDWQLNTDAPVFLPEDVRVPVYQYDGPRTREDFTGYYHEVARSDYYLGLLLDELERQGLSEDTYVIYTSDNGRPFPRDKTRLYDSGAKVPLVISGPGLKAGDRVTSLVSLIDIAPTVLDLAKVQVPDRFQGVSLMPLLLGGKEAVRDYVFVEHNWHTYPAHERMVRFEDWVYIRNEFFRRRNLSAESSRVYPAGEELWDAEAAGLLKPEQCDVFLKPRPYEELYHLGDDPDQLVNYAESGRFQEELSHLRKVLDQWIDETGDTVPSNPTTVIGNPRMSERGEFPGASRNATAIQLPGPIVRSDVD